MSRLSRSILVLSFFLACGAALADSPAPDATPTPAPAVAAPPAPAPEPSEFKFAMHGFAGVSFYVQDTPSFVLNGTGPLLPLIAPTTGITTGADIRQSRFNFSVTGPKVMGATPKAVLEIDLFGLNSPGGYGEVSAYSRVRLAYAEMNWGNDVLRLGQDHELILGGIVPDSLAHIAFLSTYFNGQLGWREPGLGIFHTIPMDKDKLELALQIIKSDWQNPTDFGNSTVDDLNVDYGQLSGYPGFEARVKYSSDLITAFIAGHFNHVAGSNANTLVVAPATTPTRDWDVIAGVATVKLTYSGLNVVVSGYTGKNTGPLLGEMLQFFVTNDVHEWGGWAQVGYEITKELSATVVGGLARPNSSDVQAAGGGRAQSSMVGGMIRYKVGGFAFGPEFYHVITNDIDAHGNDTGDIDANQFLLTGLYYY